MVPVWSCGLLLRKFTVWILIRLQTISSRWKSEHTFGEDAASFFQIVIFHDFCPLYWTIYIYIYNLVCWNGILSILRIIGQYMWFVPKVSVLICYLNVYWTHLKLQVISFKVWPLGSYRVVPTFFPLIIAVLEVIFHKCVWLIGYNFLYVFHRPDMMTLQLRFQLWEEAEMARS